LTRGRWVHIRYLDHGCYGFRPYGDSLLNSAKVSKTLLPHHSAPQIKIKSKAEAAWQPAWSLKLNSIKCVWGLPAKASAQQTLKLTDPPLSRGCGGLSKLCRYLCTHEPDKLLRLRTVTYRNKICPRARAPSSMPRLFMLPAQPRTRKVSVILRGTSPKKVTRATVE